MLMAKKVNKGKQHVAIDPNLHKLAKKKAIDKGGTLGEYIEELIEKDVTKEKETTNSDKDDKK